MPSMDEKCKNCGFSYGSHCGSAYYSDFYKQQIPNFACPGHEEKMDWANGGGTVFEPLKKDNI